MKVYEFGSEHPRIIVLIHPSAVTWDYFSDLIPLLENHFHLFVPALPGYDLSNSSTFTSVERIASELTEELIKRDIFEVEAIYGCSMGGSIALRMALENRLNVRHFIMDGGITPYQLPYLITRFIAFRDFCIISSLKLGGVKIISKALRPPKYTQEDCNYVASILKHCSYQTLWNTFDSCNNYEMPKLPFFITGKMHYWYAEEERRARDWDLKYMRKFVRGTVFKKFKGMDHGELAVRHPKRLANALFTVIHQESPKHEPSPKN